MSKILSFDESIELSHKTNLKYYKNYINKGLAIAFRILGLNILDIKSAKGCKIILSNGESILDMTSGIGVLALGHNHPKIIEVERKFQDLNLIDSQKFGANKLQSALAYNLSQLLPEDLEVSFFAVSGSEANEAAIKLATMAQGKQAEYFISANEGYHGKTHGALSLTDSENFSEGFQIGIPKKNLIKIKFDNIDEYINIIKKISPDKIAAIIVEPLQGQTVEVPKKNYLKNICKISKENNIITIFDEVKCGLGRTGKLFSFFNDECLPDIITISKALGGGKNAISAMVSRKKIFLRAYGSIKKSALHTTTFFGLGEACATAIETLNIISNENFLTNVEKKSKFLNDRLDKLRKDYPQYIKKIKGKGLFLGIEFDFDNIISNFVLKKIRIPFIKDIKTILMGALVREYLNKYKILLHFNNAQPEILVILPPLIINEQELSYFLKSTREILNQGLVKVLAKFIINNITNK